MMIYSYLSALEQKVIQNSKGIGAVLLDWWFNFYWRLD